MNTTPDEDYLTVPEVMSIYRFRSDRAARGFMRQAGGAVVGGKLLVRRCDARRDFDRLAASARARRLRGERPTARAVSSHRGKAGVLLPRGAYLED